MKKTISKLLHRLKHHPNHWVRKTLAMLLIIGGLLGFLPILGFWMLPLGLVLLFSRSPLYWRLRKAYVSRRRRRKLSMKNLGDPVKQRRGT